MSKPTPATRSKFTRLSPGLIGVGVLVVALGFGVPQFAPKDAPLPDPAPARPASALEPLAPPSAAGIGVALLKLVVGLAVVCGLCVFLTRWLKAPAPAVTGGLEVLAAIAVGRCALHLVRAGERRLLIGTDPAGVKALVELSGSGTPASVEAVPEPAPVLLATSAAADPVPPPAPVPLSRDEVLDLLLRLRARTGAPPSG